MSKAPAAIALCRVSTAEQAQTNHSLARQEVSVQAAAARLNMPLERIWSLDQSSKVGKNKNRKDLKEMLEYCAKNRHIKYLIVDELDRFIRDADYFIFYKVSFAQVGVTFHFASQPELNEEGVMTKLLQAVKAITAESSNEERMAKSLNGLKARVRLGYHPLPVLQGYKKTATPGLHEPDEPRFSRLQNAFRQILGGTRPVQALRNLTLEGYLTPQGKELSLNRFMRLLRSPYYAGILRVERWDMPDVRGLHQKMITEDEFNHLQAILDGKKFKKPRKDHNPEFPQSGVMLCNECGGKLVGFMHQNGKGGVWPKYRCRGCKKQFKREDVHVALSNFLGSICIRAREQEALARAIEKVWRSNQEDSAHYIKQLETRQESLREERVKYLRALADNPDLKEAYKEQISRVDTEIAKLEEELERARDVDQDLVEFVRFSIDFIVHQKEKWWDLEFEDMVRCKQLLFPTNYAYGTDKKVYTSQISPLFRLKETKITTISSDESCLVEVRGVAPLSTVGNCGVLHAYFRIKPDSEDETLTRVSGCAVS